MRVTILGCRGSTPATGAAFDRYGGDTSSVAVAEDGEAPTLVLDAGTGLRRLCDVPGGAPFRGAILLTHLHWDHTHGLPFASAVDHDDADVDLFLPAQGADPVDVLARALGPPHFPILPTGLRGRWRFHALDAGTHHIGGFEVVAAEVPHKGGRTFGYRVTNQRTTLAYIPDFSQARATADPTELTGDVDLLLFDAQHTADEMRDKGFLGHASAEFARDVACRSGACRLGLFHHDPSRTDAAIDALATRLRHDDLDISAAAAASVYAV